MRKTAMMSHSITRKLVIVFFLIVIALIHVFRLGQILEGQFYNLYYSYFSDFVLPFAAYFLLSISETSIPVMRHWYVKAGIIFCLAASAEICQFFGLEVLGKTFDPIDIFVYGMGLSFAAVIDIKVLIPYCGIGNTVRSQSRSDS